MEELLRAEAYKTSADITQVLVNTQDKAADDGCDAYTPPASLVPSWLSDRATCWQLKAGSAGQPSRLKGEVRKPEPRRVLKEGGRFVLVASGAGGGKAAVDSRLNVLRADARSSRLPLTSVEVITSEGLANWINEHPAVAAMVGGLPAGCTTLDIWANDPQHQNPWHADSVREAQILEVRRALDLLTAGPHHVHVSGLPGVGKSRFALEVCRDAAWRLNVLYVADSKDSRVSQLIDAISQRPRHMLVLVVDEVETSDIHRLSQAAQRGAGRIRLVTIGHDRSAEGEVLDLVIEPIPPEVLRRVIQQWHPAMPLEQVRFVGSFSDGFVKLARLAADTVVRAPSTNVAELLRTRHIRALMDEMLGAGVQHRRALHVLAVLKTIGWSGAKQTEAQAVCGVLHLDWAQVQAEVQDFHRRLGIAPRGGDLRFISPNPLGVYLAMEAWETHPDLMRSLAAALPDDVARAAMYARLREIADSAFARDFAAEELQRFFRWDHFREAAAVERWVAVSHADPRAASSSVRTALEAATPQQRLTIQDRARRALVNRLVEMACQPTLFEDAMISLAMLAEAENETWANSATGEFVDKYQLFLSATAVPYRDRVPVLRYLIDRRSSALHDLVLKASARVSAFNNGRMNLQGETNEAQLAEWHPRDGDERLRCLQEALGVIKSVVSEAEASNEVVTEVVRSLLELFVFPSLTTALTDVVGLAVTHRPALREPLRREIMEALRHQRSYGGDLPPGTVVALETMAKQLEDPSPLGRLTRLLNDLDWHNVDQHVVSEAASLLVETPDLLASSWAWLTSGDVKHAWHLGVVLAGVLDSQQIEAVMRTEQRGPDLRLLAGYFATLHPEAASRDAWLDDFEARLGVDPTLEAEVIWRSADTGFGAQRIARFLRNGQLSAKLAGQLAYGEWAQELSPEDARTIAESMVSAGDAYRSAAIGFIYSRVRVHPEFLTTVSDLALTLTCDPEMVRARAMEGHYWEDLAVRVAPKHGSALAKAIFQAQSSRQRPRWFLQHSAAEKVIYLAVDADPLGVWEALTPFLEDTGAALFIIGFPAGVIDRCPRSHVMAWISADVERRGALIARLASTRLDSGSLAVALLDRFGTKRVVSDAVFGQYISGGWSGPASEHWAGLAEQLERVDPGGSAAVKRWISGSAASLRRMASTERKSEEEDRLRQP